MRWVGNKDARMKCASLFPTHPILLTGSKAIHQHPLGQTTNGPSKTIITITKPYWAFNSKRRWGMEPIPDRWNPRDWLFWDPSGSPVALSWLRAQEQIPVL